MDDETLIRDDAPITSGKDFEPKLAVSAEAVTIRKSARELYEFWRGLTRLPTFMDNLESIEIIDQRRSRWTAKAPAGKTVSWESLITEDVPGKSISWQSAEGSQITNNGKIEFKDAGERGTIVRAVIAYDPPAGTVGKLVAKLFQREPRIQSRRDLRRFKQLMETGEIATNARNPRMQAEQEGGEA